MTNRKRFTNSEIFSNPSRRPKSFRLLWLLVSLWLAGASPLGLSLACGPGGDYLSRGWFFFEYHELTDVTHPLCLGRWRLNRLHHEDGREEAMIRKAWADYAATHKIEDDIAEMLYSLSFEPLENALVKAEGEQRLTLQALRDYGQFVAAVAPVTHQRGRLSWTYREPEEKHKAAQPLKEQAALAFQTAKDPFLRERWAFQYLRLEALYGSADQVEALYQQVFATSQDLVLKVWAEGYLAKTWRDRGRRLDAAQQYLRLWRTYPWTTQRMLTSLELLRLKSEEWQALIEQTQDPTVKAYAYYVRSLLRGRDFSVDSLRGAVAAAPESPAAQSLLELFIHNIEFYEQDHLVSRFTGDAPVGTRFLALAEFVDRQAQAGKVGDPGFWFLTAAYLYLLDGRHQQAATALAVFDQRFADQPKLRELRQILKVLHGFLAEPDQAVAHAIQPVLIELAPKAPPETFYYEPFDPGRSLMAFAGYRTVKAGDVLNGALLFKASGLIGLGHSLWNYVVTLEDLPRWSEAGPMPKKPRYLEAYLRQFLPQSPAFFEEYRAMLLIRDEHYEQAEQVLAQLRSAEKASAEGNAAAAVTLPKVRWSEVDPLTRDGKIPLEQRADLLAWTRHILNLKKRAAQAADGAARNAVNRRLGHIFLTSVVESEWYYPWFNHFPVHGKPYRQLQPIYSPFGYDLFPNMERLLPKIPGFPARTGNQRAAKYYREILASSEQAEDAAEACVLLQICGQQTLSKDVEPDPDKHAYYYKLARDYGDTAFYQKFQKSCPTIEKFQ